MPNEYVIQASDIFDESSQSVLEGNFLTLLAKAEKHYKEILNAENLRCSRCQLIIGNNFKLGVRISSNQLNPKFAIFSCHPSCMDGRLYGDYYVTKDKEVELSAPAFLECEEIVLFGQKEFHKALDMLEIRSIDGAWKVFMNYEKAGVATKDNIRAAALVRFREVAQKGSKIICRVCSKEVKEKQERELAIMPNGPKKDASVELVHSQCSTKLQSIFGGLNNGI